MEDEVGRCRAALAGELGACAESIRAEVAPWALGLSIGEFLALESVMERVDAASRLSSASTTVFAEPTSVRRSTRSAAPRQPSLAPSDAGTEFHDATSRKSTLVVPATPRFHPGLPETPAAVRSAAGRASVRGSILATPVGRGRRPAGRDTLPAPANLISVQLDSGATVDVDITQSPSKIASGLGADAVRELRAKMSVYASQLRVFFSRLRT